MGIIAKEKGPYDGSTFEDACCCYGLYGVQTASSHKVTTCLLVYSRACSLNDLAYAIEATTYLVEER